MKIVTICYERLSNILRMTSKEIDTLISQGEFPETTRQRKRVETHISWAILCDQFAYKIKKPIKYTFLDFSTLKLRKHFCERELQLNQRFSKDIYLDVVPIKELQGHYVIGGKEGIRIDYALKMRKLSAEKQMDVLLSKNKVSESDIKNLAERIVDFHKGATVIYEKNVIDIREEFNDLGLEKQFLRENLDSKYANGIDQALTSSNIFLRKNEELLNDRLRSGFFRDCHGDLHTRNIFLLPEPQPFDCIEFNDDYRQIDVLNEVAFLCMDLDASGRTDLSDVFIEQYNRLFPAMRTEAERKLFIYYKSYRANVRAKVNSLRARSASSEGDRKKAFSEVKNYLALMESYMRVLN